MDNHLVLLISCLLGFLISGCMPPAREASGDCQALVPYDALFQIGTADSIFRGSILLIDSSGDTIASSKVPQRGTWIVDLKRLEEIRPGGMISKLRPLPKLETCEGQSLCRYISLGNAIDAGILVGVARGSELVYLVSSTWRAGLVCPAFVSDIQGCGLSMEAILDPGLPEPPPPPLPVVDEVSYTPRLEKLSAGVIVWRGTPLSIAIASISTKRMERFTNMSERQRSPSATYNLMLTTPTTHC